MTLEPMSDAERRINTRVDGSGVSAFVARAAVLGITEKPPMAPMRTRYPQEYPRSGHVRDFGDGGRPDEFRGGPQLDRWLTPHEEETMHVGRQMVRATQRFYEDNGLAALPSDEQERLLAKFIEEYRKPQQPLF